MSLINDAKVPLKKMYYRVFEEALPEELRIDLGYIFHTEAIYDARLFAQLLQFLKDYWKLTEKRAICTIITPDNPLVKAGMKKNSVSPEEFLDRVRILNDTSDLGYHGHYFYDKDHFAYPEAEIRSNNFYAPAVREQFLHATAWFEENGLSHNGLYSAGWWVMNEMLQRLLIEKGFKYDFSMSYSPWFRDQNSFKFMRKHNILTAELARVSTDAGKIVCVQNLIGCHTTPFVEDFIRNLKGILNPFVDKGVAVTHSHDFDLDPTNTLRCIEHLMKIGNFKIIEADDLDATVARSEVIDVALEN